VAKDHPVKLENGLIYKTARKLVVLLIGSTVLLFGIIMLVTPGPGLLGILAGLGILATEFLWARVFLRKLKERCSDAVSRTAKNTGTVSDMQASPAEHDESALS
jgi:uncharacterized protein (TIGR02611 family)